MKNAPKLFHERYRETSLTAADNISSFTVPVQKVADNNILLETGIKDNSYIITDFSDEKKLCELARITHDEILRTKK